MTVRNLQSPSQAPVTCEERVRWALARVASMQALVAQYPDDATYRLALAAREAELRALRATCDPSTTT